MNFLGKEKLEGEEKKCLHLLKQKSLRNFVKLPLLKVDPSGPKHELIINKL